MCMRRHIFASFAVNTIQFGWKVIYGLQTKPISLMSYTASILHIYDTCGSNYVCINATFDLLPQWEFYYGILLVFTI